MYKSNVNKIRKDLNKKRESAASAIGVLAEAESKMRVPVDTGHLRRSISHNVENQKDKSIIKVGSNVEYDPIVEMGAVSRNISAQPHHYPAFSENIANIRSIIKKEMSFK